MTRTSQTDEELRISKLLVAKATLNRYPRTKILESYFLRMENPDSGSQAPLGLEELYAVDIDFVKEFLLGQHPQDDILASLLKISG